ncbi:hypothetical protein [Flavobacterium sp.]|uniref:hypothetical protein n=1 Tax=Flavobacterium sp. TaxID=239 RepID=UPI00262228B5|nr:hypothetical protein [Flavobacterium sp.]
MKFQVSDRVELTEERNYPDGDNLPARTKGTVQKVHVYENAYTVKFDGAKNLHKVPEDILA